MTTSSAAPRHTKATVREKTLRECRRHSRSIPCLALLAVLSDNMARAFPRLSMLQWVIVLVARHPLANVERLALAEHHDSPGPDFEKRTVVGCEENGRTGRVDFFEEAEDVDG